MHNKEMKVSVILPVINETFSLTKTVELILLDNQKDIYDYITGLDYNITNIKTNNVLSYEEFNEQTFSDKPTLHNFIARKK